VRVKTDEKDANKRHVDPTRRDASRPSPAISLFALGQVGLQRWHISMIVRSNTRDAGRGACVSTASTGKADERSQRNEFACLPKAMRGARGGSGTPPRPRVEAKIRVDPNHGARHASKFEQAQKDPKSVFAQPQDIVNSRDLSRPQKLTLLTEWSTI